MITVHGLDLRSTLESLCSLASAATSKVCSESVAVFVQAHHVGLQVLDSYVERDNRLNIQVFHVEKQQVTY